MELRGRARKLPDNVYTDHIISSWRKRDAATVEDAVPYIFEDLAPPLSAPVSSGDILVAGANFGCGSAMEIAVEVLLTAGVRAIVARSFARTYYRNAVNAGLPALEADTSLIGEGDELVIRIGDCLQLLDVTRGIDLGHSPAVPFAVQLIEARGLLEYFRAHGALPRGII